ncbi:MAG: hypothetical protein JW951_07380 [Lentisphaerae bacterium]|nr:hypothetical protein [Lentisphaerota bacterium]
MNDLERFHATTQHRRPDRLLYYLNFTPDLERRVREREGLDGAADLRTHFGGLREAGITLEPPAGWREPDWSVFFEDVEQPPGCRYDANGCLHVPTDTYHFTHRVSPLRHAVRFDEIKAAYPWNDWNRWGTAHFPKAVRDAHAAGAVAVGAIGHMYESAWQVRGYEPFLMDMIGEPETPHFILDYYKERNKRIAVAAAEAGADMLRTGDDVANQNALMFSKDMWREFMKTKWAEVYAAAKTVNPDIRIWYHSDGNITDIIDELIEIGVDILNPLQPECIDLQAVKRRYGSRLVMDGTIGTQTTMPFGTPDDVRACVRERVKTLGGDGALILSPTHVLEPEVPIENVLAFVEACRAYGAA